MTYEERAREAEAIVERARQEHAMNTGTDFRYDPPRQTYRMPSYSRFRSPDHRMHRGHAAAWLITILVLAAIGTVLALVWNFQYGTERTVTGTITALDDQSSGSSHKYLIYMTDVKGNNGPADEVFEDSDSLFHWKFNSSDVYFGLRKGERVQCSIYGIRNHVLSSYPDILGCTKIG